MLHCSLQILFSRAEALHAHGHTRDACRLAQKLAEELLSNPPDLLAETANLPSLKGFIRKFKIHCYFLYIVHVEKFTEKNMYLKL